MGNVAEAQRERVGLGRTQGLNRRERKKRQNRGGGRRNTSGKLDCGLGWLEKLSTKD